MPHSPSSETSGAAARTVSVLADLDFEAGHPPQAVARLEPVIAELEAHEPDPALAEVAAQLGRFLIFAGDSERAAPYLERSLYLAEVLDLPEIFVQALNSKSVLAMRANRNRESLILIEGALEIALAHEFHAAALRAYNNLSVGLWITDQWQANMATVESALELARHVGHRNWEANFVAASVGALGALGRWDEAIARAAETQDLATDEFARGLALYVVPLLSHRGLLTEARALLEQNASIRRSENSDSAGGYAMNESVLLRAEGDLAGARAAAERVLALDVELNGVGKIFLYEALQVASAVEDVAWFRELLARLDELPPGLLTQHTRANRARFRAQLPEADVESEFRTAERLFAELGLVFDLAVTRLEHAERLVAAGRTPEVEPLLNEAREGFEQLQAAPWIERIRRIQATAETVNA